MATRLLSWLLAAAMARTTSTAYCGAGPTSDEDSNLGAVTSAAPQPQPVATQPPARRLRPASHQSPGSLA